jgi:transcriptional regulator with XRE-family HTH domain
MSSIHIGQLIKEQVKRKRIRVSQLSDKLNVSEPNVYKIYLRSSIDTELLEKISIALDYNFFSIYASRFTLDTKDSRITQCEKENELLRQLVNEKEAKYQLLLSARREY